jgi:hypothetical protein
LHTQRFSLVAFRDHFFDVFSQGPRSRLSSSRLPTARRFGSPPALPNTPNLKKEADEYLGEPGTARGWPLATP